jgi:hypothetical protein
MGIFIKWSREHSKFRVYKQQQMNYVNKTCTTLIDKQRITILYV